jgi:hypothetical protein
MRKGKKIGLVVTTISDGGFSLDFLNKIEEEGVTDWIQFIIIPDEKTPQSIWTSANFLKRRGIDVVCPTLQEQEQYLKKFGKIFNIIPYNSDNRRNIGFLISYENGNDILVSIDDDNYPVKDVSYFKEHYRVLTRDLKSAKSLDCSNGWYNICEMLTLDEKNIYPRGYPYYARHRKIKIKSTVSKGSAHINAGLWLDSPDVDAMTYLSKPTKARSFNGTSFFLASKTWSPLNTQNTALLREVIPAYYFVRMGYPVMGLNIDRYGDIFSGYFALKCAKHLGHNIRFGSPVVEHVRNSHNYLKDLAKEIMCILVLEDFLPWLVEIKLDGSTYKEAYLSLACQMEDAVEKFQGSVWDDSTRGYFHYLAYCMRVWIKTIDVIEGTK